MKWFLLMFVVSASGLYEEDLCSVRGAAGVCKLITNCPAALQGIKSGKLPQNCGFSSSGTPIVCCEQSASTITTTRRPALTTNKPPLAVSTTTEYVPPVYEYVDIGDKSGDGCAPIPPSLTSKPIGRKYWDKCLEYQEKLVFPCTRSPALSGGNTRLNKCHHNADDLIVGGVEAKPNEFPHMALLGYGDDPSSLVWLCGGTLISERFVLTAGHCIASRDNGPLTHVELNRLRRSDNLSGRHRYKVKDIIPHPEFRSPIKYNDIALLRLETTVPLDEWTVPACLPPDELDANRASATGWGDTQYNGKNSDALLKVVLTEFNPFECAIQYEPKHNLESGVDQRTQVCYGDRTMSKDTCQGDSGGPLQVKSRQIACMYMITGVTSFGRSCGIVGKAGIYTKVAPYRDWIESIVWP